MKAARLESIGAPLRVVDVEEPRLQPGAVIVRVLRAGVGSAARACFAGRAFAPPPVPYTPGPNGVSIIERVADDVHGLSPGQVVVHDPTHIVTSNDPQARPAGLLIGWIPMTPNAGRITELYKNGAWAEKQLLPATSVHPVPAGALERLGPNRLLRVVELGIAHGALLSGGFRAGHTVLVNGAAGKLGSATVALALALGSSRVYAVGRSRARLERVAQLDARVIPVSSGEGEGLAAQVPEGADLVVDFLGYTTDTRPTEACLGCLRPGGTAVFGGGVAGAVSIPYSQLLALQQRVVGTFMFPRTTPRLIMDLLLAGPLAELLDRTARPTVEFALPQVDEAVTLAAEGRSDAVLVIGG